MDLDLWQGKIFQVVKRSSGNQNHGTLWLQWNIILEYLRVHSPTLWLSHRVPCHDPRCLWITRPSNPTGPLAWILPKPKRDPAVLLCETSIIFHEHIQELMSRSKRFQNAKNKNIMRIPWPLFFHQDLPLLHSQQTWCISQLLLVEMPTSAPNPAGNGTSRTIVLYILVALKIFHGSHT